MQGSDIAALDGNHLKKAVRDHLSPWAVTAPCRDLLEKICARATSATWEENSEGELSIYFDTEEWDNVPVHLGSAYTGSFVEAGLRVPVSYQELVQLHNSIGFDEGVPENIDFYGYEEGDGPQSEFMMDELEGDPSRHQGFCDAGQNWVFFDHARKNALGEPVIVIADHGMVVADNDDFPDQHEVPFGTGGFFIRTMAYFVLGDNFDSYSWG